MLTWNERAYDNYVANGRGDPCFANGMSGHCGFDCSVFGSKPECLDGMDDDVRAALLLLIEKEFSPEMYEKAFDKLR
jgi:hypothetical protein